MVKNNIDGDAKDIVIARNRYGAEVETSQNDASLELFLKGNDDSTFKKVARSDNGLVLPFDVKALKSIMVKGRQYNIARVNSGSLKIISYE